MGIFSLFNAKKGWQEIKELADVDLCVITTPNLVEMWKYLYKMDSNMLEIRNKSAKNIERSIHLKNAMKHIALEIERRED